MSEIKLEGMDACVVWRENGDVEVVLPAAPGDAVVPLNCLCASLAAVAMRDEETIAALEAFVKERTDDKHSVEGNSG